MVHQWVENGDIPTVNGRQNHPPLFEKKLKIGGVRRAQWWPDDMRCETAVAVNPLNAYEAYEGVGGKQKKEAWKQAFDDDWCTGTVDGWWWLFDDALTVSDLKTGRIVTFEAYEQQVMGYALGLARVLDYKGPVNLFIDWWPRYPVTSQPRRLGRVVEPDELLAFEKRLATLKDDIRRGRDNPASVVLNPSDQACMWCPSRSVCSDFARFSAYGKDD
jgi:hypothetical protein